MPDRHPNRHRRVAAPTVVVRGGTIVDERGTRRADLLLHGGVVAAVGNGVDVPAGSTVLDAAGCLVAPGLVDLHTHLREPGAEDAECVETGARAAALGGFTAITAMPNTDPPVDNASVAIDVLALGGDTVCEVTVAGAITRGRVGEHLAPLGELASLGVRVFTDDGTGVQDAGVMRRALEYARGLRARGMSVVLAQHCEDAALAGAGAMNEGAVSSRLGIPGAPPEAEELMVARDIALAGLTGGRVHFLHLSTARSAALVREAKRRGLAVSAEVAPHHLALTEDELSGYDPVFKVNPPLRGAHDVAALRAACGDGTIDAVATDHAPHPSEAKEQPFEEAAPGMLGLETALAVTLAALGADDPDLSPGDGGDIASGEGRGDGAPRDDRGMAQRQRDPLDARAVIGLMSWRPARLAGLAVDQGGDQGGPLVEGAPANLCVIDPTERWLVVPERFASRSRNSPWAERTLTGRVRHTVYRGEPVVSDGQALR